MGDGDMLGVGLSEAIATVRAELERAIEGRAVGPGIQGRSD